jgi:hypothetical protein
MKKTSYKNLVTLALKNATNRKRKRKRWLYVHSSLLLPNLIPFSQKTARK